MLSAKLPISYSQKIITCITFVDVKTFVHVNTTNHIFIPPTSKKILLFDCLSVRPYVRPLVRPYVTLFRSFISLDPYTQGFWNFIYELLIKISWHAFFLFPSHSFWWSSVPYQTFENPVSKISKEPLALGSWTVASIWEPMCTWPD